MSRYHCHIPGPYIPSHCRGPESSLRKWYRRRRRAIRVIVELHALVAAGSFIAAFLICLI